MVRHPREAVAVGAADEGAVDDDAPTPLEGCIDLGDEGHIGRGAGLFRVEARTVSRAGRRLGSETRALLAERVGAEKPEARRPRQLGGEGRLAGAAEPRAGDHGRPIRRPGVADGEREMTPRARRCCLAVCGLHLRLGALEPFDHASDGGEVTGVEGQQETHVRIVRGNDVGCHQVPGQLRALEAVEVHCQEGDLARDVVAA